MFPGSPFLEIGANDERQATDLRDTHAGAERNWRIAVVIGCPMGAAVLDLTGLPGGQGGRHI